MSRRQCDQIPELGKLRHFGKKCFWKNIESYWVFGRNFELIWIKNCHSANLCRCNWPNIEQINLAIGSHWYYVGRWCTILMGLWNLMHAFTLCLFESIEPSGRINVFFVHDRQKLNAETFNGDVTYLLPSATQEAVLLQVQSHIRAKGLNTGRLHGLLNYFITEVLFLAILVFIRQGLQLPQWSERQTNNRLAWLLYAVSYSSFYIWYYSIQSFNTLFLVQHRK